MARLIIGIKDHGVHPFIVQLRSLSDYTPLPGIELGDIGIKMGLNSTDNGFASFRNVRIPRTHLLMRRGWAAIQLLRSHCTLRRVAGGLSATFYA